MRRPVRRTDEALAAPATSRWVRGRGERTRCTTGTTPRRGQTEAASGGCSRADAAASRLLRVAGRRDIRALIDLERRRRRPGSRFFTRSPLSRVPRSFHCSFAFYTLAPRVFVCACLNKNIARAVTSAGTLCFRSLLPLSLKLKGALSLKKKTLQNASCMH